MRIQPLSAERGQSHLIEAQSGASISLISLEDAFASAYRSAWDTLAASAEEPNVFLERWMLAPSRKLFGQESARLLWIADSYGPVGLALVAPARGYARLPLRCLRSALHPHLFLATPLVAKGRANAFAGAVSDWLNTAPREIGFLHFTHLDGDGPVARALYKASSERGNFCAEVDRRTRPMIVGQRDPDSYLAAVAGPKRRKRIRRLRRRLEDLGDVRFETYSESSSTALDCWTEDFLSLEHQGWKGEAGTSILSSPVEADYYRAIVQKAFVRGQLLFSRLTLDGRALAYALDLRSGEGVFSLKTAYDHSYSRLSPGIQLETLLLERYLRDESIQWVDSCAAPGANQLDSLWGESRALSQIVIGRNSWRSAPLRLATCLERGSAWLRSLFTSTERHA